MPAYGRKPLNRVEALRRVGDGLGDRRLVWLGPSGDSAVPLEAIPQFSHAFSLYASPVAGRARHTALEDLTGVRGLELDYEVMLSGAGKPFVDGLVRACRDDSVLLPFMRPPMLRMLAASGSRAWCVAPSRALTKLLNTKPAVEAALRGAPGVSLVPWEAVPAGAERYGVIARELDEAPVVLRAAVSSGGRGFELLQERPELEGSRLAGSDAPLYMAPYYADHVPLNVGGCVFPDGGVTTHALSYQLIGIEGCTALAFGFCGNDFAAARGLDRDVVEAVEACALAVGRWLHSKGYVGAFGVDTMVVGDRVMFAEVNPRFQASSKASALLEAGMGAPDVYLDHLMAWMGLPSHAQAPLYERVASQAAFSQVVCANPGPSMLRLPAPSSEREGMGVRMLPGPEVRVRPGASMFCLEVEGQVTDDGRRLYASVDEVVSRARSGWTPA